MHNSLTLNHNLLTLNHSPLTLNLHCFIVTVEILLYCHFHDIQINPSPPFPPPRHCIGSIPKHPSPFSLVLIRATAHAVALPTFRTIKARDFRYALSPISLFPPFHLLRCIKRGLKPTATTFSLLIYDRAAFIVKTT